MIENQNIEIPNSIKPSIAETERFIIFLSKRFNLPLKDDLIINIQKTGKTTKGFFMPSSHPEHYTNCKQDLKYICLSSFHLKSEPYETIAHEFAHYVNDCEGNKAKNNYHSKEFKKISEILLLSVSKGKHGYNETRPTDAFIKLLDDFKPSSDAFLIFQNIAEQKPKNSRMLLYTCSCGVKIRTAKNEDKPLMAICQYCKTEFSEVIGE